MADARARFPGRTDEAGRCFVDALSYYKTDFMLFPEFFNAALLGLFDQKNQVESIRKLAEFTPAMVENGQPVFKLQYQYHRRRMPLVEDGKLYNVSYVFLRDGSIHTQYKIHITPGERRVWAMDGGDQLQVIETDVGKIGVLICYDVEFPELARLQAEQGINPFRPFLDGSKNGFLRVQRCAQARAIEEMNATSPSAGTSATCRRSRMRRSNMRSRRSIRLRIFPSPMMRSWRKPPEHGDDFDRRCGYEAARYAEARGDGEKPHGSST